MHLLFGEPEGRRRQRANLEEQMQAFKAGNRCDDISERGKTRFTYVVRMEPRRLVRIGDRLSRTNFGSMFRNACKGLQRYVANAR